MLQQQNISMEKEAQIPTGSHIHKDCLNDKCSRGWCSKFLAFGHTFLASLKALIITALTGKYEQKIGKLAWFTQVPHIKC